MKVTREQLQLYAVTDRSWLEGITIEEVVDEAIQGGVTLVQLRELQASEEELLEEALRLKSICAKYQVPLLVDDNVEVCKRADLDGVHVGQDDMAVTRAREILGEGKIIGATAHNLEEAIKAQEMGADYLGSGAAFGTKTKKDARPIDREEYKKITSAVQIPVCAIGGINEENAQQLQGYGLSGIAVIAGIFGAKDIKKASESLRTIAKEL